MAKEINLSLSLIQEKAVMNGFCFSFCLCLLNKLKRLKAEGKVYDPKDDTRGIRGLEDISRTIISHLCEQIHCPNFTRYETTPTGIFLERMVNDLIKTTEEFLEVFVAYPAPLPVPPPSPSNGLCPSRACPED